MKRQNVALHSAGRPSVAAGSRVHYNILISYCTPSGKRPADRRLATYVSVAGLPGSELTPRYLKLLLVRPLIANRTV